MQEEKVARGRIVDPRGLVSRKEVRPSDPWSLRRLVGLRFLACYDDVIVVAPVRVGVGVAGGKGEEVVNGVVGVAEEVAVTDSVTERNQTDGNQWNQTLDCQSELFEHGDGRIHL